MSTQPTKGRLVQVAQSYTNGGDIRKLESGEFGLGLDEGQERLWIGSHSGNIQVVTERNIAQLAIPDGSVGRSELDGEVNTLLDSIGSATNIPEATTSQKGLMSSTDKIKLNSIESGANNTTIVNNLTSLSTTSALSAYQGKLLKDVIDNIGGGGGGGGSTVAVVDNLTSTDTTSALSANQGRIIKGLIDDKADKTTATTTSNGLMSASDKQKLDNINGNGGTTVVNTLTSTSTSDALSAYQGKVLNDSKLSGYQSGNNTGTTGTTIGMKNEATGDYSFAIGHESKATGHRSFASGILTRATNDNSVVFGASSSASGRNSIAIGFLAQAKNYASMAVGVSPNMTLTNANDYNSTADAFVIGNGGLYTQSNAFRVTFDGKVFGRSAYSSSGADYAEMFEWSDGNIDNEDRVGYFVTLDGDKIRKATSSDTYILGIISANPSVVGDSASEGFHEQYVKDDFGRIQYHYVDVEHEEIDENGEIIKVIKNEYHPVYNPQYNPQAPYTPREDRKEWDAVGMMGKLLVRDDGTCKVNGYCKPNDDGIATKTIASSNIKYRVMKRVSDNIIQVLVK